MAQLVAKQYAKAIFELALDRNMLDEYFEQALFLRDTIQTNPELLNTILHPQITGSEKLQMFENIFKESVAPDFFGLFDILLKKNREEELLGILDFFMESVQQHKGSVTATVHSAIPLSENQTKRITASLEKALGKKVEIVSEIMPHIIGGLRISCDGRVLDATVKKQFDDMKKLLKEC